MSEKQQISMLYKFCRKYAMDQSNTTLVVNKIRFELREELTDYSKREIRAIHVRWFTDRYTMDEYNTEYVINFLKNLFNEPLTSREDANQILQHYYVRYFKKNFAMDETNKQILNDRYLKLFGENYYVVVKNEPPATYSAGTYHISSDRKIIDKKQSSAPKMVAAGDALWDAQEYLRLEKERTEKKLSKPCGDEWFQGENLFKTSCLPRGIYDELVKRGDISKEADACTTHIAGSKTTYTYICYQDPEHNRYKEAADRQAAGETKENCLIC